MKNNVTIDLLLARGDNIFSMEKNLIKVRKVVSIHVDITSDGTVIKYGTKEIGVDKNCRYVTSENAFATREAVVANLMDKSCS